VDQQCAVFSADRSVVVCVGCQEDDLPGSSDTDIVSRDEDLHAGFFHLGVVLFRGGVEFDRVVDCFAVL
jgi:hypothetical protein